MHDQTVQVDDLRLVALPSAMNCADMFVRFTLTEWRVKSMVTDVTNTAKSLVRAVVGEVDKSAPLAMITVRLRLSGSSLSVEIEDDRPTPRLVVPPELSQSSSGVEVLADGRQLIWSDLPLPTGMDATVVPLPRRGTTRAPAIRPAEDENISGLDDEMMNRILNALKRDPDQPR
ncbi:ATP-binding protein [Actinophytocola gossypii]|uniref:ATP-binding protein n=1 Tax=Actinophytocola gossypii TaxID=2812003 RepID=A0ABT2JC21_9PSEU|nr:ATP-binding protein [Actinophytocola gossypii]MCT2585420.1 ATP-binding protein [Actinophytocola gossypii]